MRKKKNDLNGVWKQLELPFEPTIKRSNSEKIVPNNIINFSSTWEANKKKEDDRIKNKNIDRLLNYAAKLNW